MQDIEREKDRIVNDYELKILLMKNEMQQTKEEFESREEDLKEVL